MKGPVESRDNLQRKIEDLENNLRNNFKENISNTESENNLNQCNNILKNGDVIYITDYPDVTAGVVNKNKPKTKKLVR